MTKLLEEALSRVQKLPPAEQNLIAQLVLEELDSERRWDSLISQTSDKLDALAQQALNANRRGETEAINPEKL
jgi:hypothetical protein